MSKTEVNIRKLVSAEDCRVTEMVAELERAVKGSAAATLWTERLAAGVKGGKMPGA